MKYVAICTILLSMTVGTVLAAPVLVPAPGQEFQETLDQPRSVSSTAVVGMIVFSNDAIPDETMGSTLYVYLPSGLSDTDRLRIEVESADSRYRGAGVFLGITAPPGHWVELPLLPEGHDTIRPNALPLGELAVSAARLIKGPNPHIQRLVASWTSKESENSDTSQLRVFVNSRRAEVSAPNSTCNRVKSSSTLAFDFICDTNVADLKIGPNGERGITITRVDAFEREPIRVLVPLSPISSAQK